MSAQRNCPQGTAGGANPRVEIIVVLDYQSTAVRAIAGRMRMLPDLSFDLIERLRKSGVDLLVLSQAFDYFEDRIDLRYISLRSPISRKDCIAPSAEIGHDRDRQQDVRKAESVLAFFSFYAAHGS